MLAFIKRSFVENPDLTSAQIKPLHIWAKDREIPGTVTEVTQTIRVIVESMGMRCSCTPTSSRPGGIVNDWMLVYIWHPSSEKQ